MFPYPNCVVDPNLAVVNFHSQDEDSEHQLFTLRGLGCAIRIRAGRVSGRSARAAKSRFGIELVTLAGVSHAGYLFPS